MDITIPPIAHCPFCNVAQDRILVENETALALHDSFPVTEGHTLVVPRRHITSIYELEGNEYVEIWKLVARVRSLLFERIHPDGFTVGVNDGHAAGQTVPHAHIHIIPRQYGDVADPRGGIRWIIPDKAAYWQDKA
jgi:diadenosine tetraphosphate (Ap4A) HIT family hydrolase